MDAARTASRLPQVGDEIGGKYKIDGLIGEGGMGVVFAATHLRLHQRVAIKMLQPDVLAVPELVARFEREARAAALLRGRHAARVIDVSETADGLPFMVMEFLEGHDLAAELEARGRLPIGEAIDLLLQATRAIIEAHERGIIHRDLKPSNLFLAIEGEERVLKLLDFGISKLVKDDGANVTATRATMGTPLYMSPEQVRAAKKVDGRTDIWSLGVILYEVLAGVPPFMGPAAQVGAAIVADPPPPLGEARPDLPEGLEAVVLRALEKSADKRYATAGELADALAPFAPASSTRASLNDSRPRASVSELAPTLVQSAEAASSRSTAAGWSTAQGAARGGRATIAIGFALALAVCSIAWFVFLREGTPPVATGRVAVEATSSLSPSSSSSPLSAPSSTPTVSPSAAVPPPSGVASNAPVDVEPPSSAPSKPAAGGAPRPAKPPVPSVPTATARPTSPTSNPVRL